MRVKLRRFAIALACLLCLGTPAAAAAAEDPLALCLSMGLVPPHAAGWHGDRAMPRDLWAQVLGKALGTSTVATSSLPSSADRFGRSVRAYWRAVRPPPPVTCAEVLHSLAAAAHVPRAGASVGIAAPGNPATIRWSLAELLVQLQSTSLADAGDPVTAVRGYYSVLTRAVGRHRSALSDLANWCCGEALARLQRNLPALGPDAVFRLVSLEVDSVQSTGWLAEVAVTRTADQQLGTVVSRTTVSDRFYLRYDGAAWKIYR